MPWSRLIVVLFVVGCDSVLLTAPVFAQTPEAYAQLRFTRGRELFGEEEYEEALAEFRESLSRVPSPNSRLYIARCLRELGRVGEATAEFMLTVAEARDRASTDPRFHRTAEAAQRELDEVREGVAWLNIDIDDPPESLDISIGERQIPLIALGVPIPVDPGRLIIRAQALEHESVVEELSLRAGQRESLRIELQPLERAESADGERGDVNEVPVERAEEPSGSRGMVIGSGIGFGVGGVGAALFATFGALALQRASELDQACGDDGCDPEYRGDLEQGQLYQTLSNVGIVVGVVGLVTGVVLLLVERRRRRVEREPARVSLMFNELVVNW